MNQLPPNLPRPTDDGKTDHLVGQTVPEVRLTATDGKRWDLFTSFQEPTVLFIYPRAASPLEPNKNPELWDTIPGARGCTPQSCGFRDLIDSFREVGVKVYGLSVQTPVVQKEFVQRNHIPYLILSDEQFEFADRLQLPTFEFEGERLIKRMSFFIVKGIIKKVFYPVFPPDKNAETVLSWLKNEVGAFR